MGPLLPLLMAGGSLLGKVLGGAGKGASDARAGQNAYAQNNDLRATANYGIAQGASTNAANAAEQAALDRAKLGLSAPSVRAKQALLGSLLKNVSSVNVQPPAGVTMGKVTGGINDLNSLIDPTARAAGGALSEQALQAILSKSDIPAATDFKASLLTPPTPTPYKSAGAMESILSTGGLLGSLLGAGGTLADLIKGNGASAPKVPGLSDELLYQG